MTVNILFKINFSVKFYSVFNNIGDFKININLKPNGVLRIYHVQISNVVRVSTKIHF